MQHKGLAFGIEDEDVLIFLGRPVAVEGVFAVIVVSKIVSIGGCRGWFQFGFVGSVVG